MVGTHLTQYHFDRLVEPAKKKRHVNKRGNCDPNNFIVVCRCSCYIVFMKTVFLSGSVRTLACQDLGEVVVKRQSGQLVSSDLVSILKAGLNPIKRLLADVEWIG